MRLFVKFAYKNDPGNVTLTGIISYFSRISLRIETEKINRGITCVYFFYLEKTRNKES